MNYYESGEMNTYSVKVEVSDVLDNRIVLNINGPMIVSYIKSDQLLSIKSKDELYDLIMNKIVIEEFDGVLDKELDDYSLNNVLNYLESINDQDNDVIISELRSIERNISKFKKELSDLDELAKISIHQYHKSSGEMCDFVDYLNIPYEDDEEVTREYLENNLSSQSCIDEIMNLFSFGEFDISYYSCVETISADLINNNVSKSVTVDEVQ